MRFTALMAIWLPSFVSSYSLHDFLSSFGRDVYDEYPAELKTVGPVPKWEYAACQVNLKPCHGFLKEILHGDLVVKYFPRVML
jgi:hypothetical protein